MEQSVNKTIEKRYIVLGLILLLSALSFGLLGAIEYIAPGFGRSFISFEKIRPLHVSSAVFWILTGAMGAVYYYLKEHYQAPLKRSKLMTVQWWITSVTFISILISYFFGIFGGREYWEFHPVFSIGITCAWLLFIIVILKNSTNIRQQPVYVWMWVTGVIFFLFTYLESNLYLIPAIKNHFIKDMTIQWKSYGSLVGSWNLLIYGSSIYLLDKIAGNQKYSRSNLAFWIFFLGLFNLMFNWGHHIYTLPTHAYVKHIAYLVSMTELLLFGRMIYLWRSSVSDAKRNFHLLPYRFLIAADFWVFLTLGLAIAMSIPAWNIYMHGTHTIVGHTMGATIGINSMLLLAYATDIIKIPKQSERNFTRFYWITNGALLFFWFSLIAAGFRKAYWQFNEAEKAYGSMIQDLAPYFYVFFAAGIVLVIGFSGMIFQLLKNAYKR